MEVNPVKTRPILLLAIFLGITAAYYPTFRGEFILDDKPFVKDNPLVRGLQPLVTYFFQEDGIVGDQIGRAHSGYYRPLTALSYSIDYCIWGFNSVGFRTTNLVLHLLTCLMLYASMRLFLRDTTGPLLAVLLFGIHPANTEAVAWVSSRNNLLVSLFAVASFFFYVRRIEKPKTGDGILSLFFFALALLSKEFAVMLLPIFLLYDRLTSRSFRQCFWGYLAFLAVLAGYMVLRKSALPDFMPPYYHFTHFLKALWFAPYLLAENLRIVLLPAGLHNFLIRHPTAFFGKESLLGLAILILIPLLLWKRRRERIVLFSVISFFGSLIPVLQIFPTSAHSFVSMRWLYFPMCFLSLSAAYAFQRVLSTTKRHMMYGIIGAGLTYLGAYTFILNDHLWKREGEFFQEEVVLFGNNFYSGDLGRIHHLRGDYTAAERYYKIALQNRSPDRVGLLSNYAVLLIELKQPEAALVLLQEAEELRLDARSRGTIHNNRGSAFFNMKDYRRAIDSFRKALSLAPEDPMYRENLGKAIQMEKANRDAGTNRNP